MPLHALRGWWWWPSAAAVLICVVAPALSSTGELLVYSLVGAMAVAVMVTGIRVNRPSRPVAWALLTVAAGFGAIAPLLWAVAPSVNVFGTALNDACFLAYYPPLVAGLALLAE